MSGVLPYVGSEVDDDYFPIEVAAPVVTGSAATPHTAMPSAQADGTPDGNTPSSLDISGGHNATAGGSSPSTVDVSCSRGSDTTSRTEVNSGTTEDHDAVQTTAALATEAAPTGDYAMQQSCSAASSTLDATRDLTTASPTAVSAEPFCATEHWGDIPVATTVAEGDAISAFDSDPHHHLLTMPSLEQLAAVFNALSSAAAVAWIEAQASSKSFFAAVGEAAIDRAALVAGSGAAIASSNSTRLLEAVAAPVISIWRDTPVEATLFTVAFVTFIVSIVINARFRKYALILDGCREQQSRRR